MKQTILILSHDKPLINSIKSMLNKANYNVIITIRADLIKSIIDKENMILSIVDGTLLEFEENELITSLRNISFDFPIATFYKDYDERLMLKAFQKGVDDCIVLHSNFEIFLARIKNLFKRYYHTPKLIKHEDITYSLENNSFYIDNKIIELTKLEKTLFLEFLKNKQKLLSRNTLIKSVWDTNSNIQHKTVTVSIQRLREKIVKHTGKEYIQTINGQGYMFL